MFHAVVTGRGHGAPIYSVAPWKNSLFTSSGDRFVVLWELNSGQQNKFTVKLDSPAYAINATDEILIIGSTNGTLTAIEISTKKVLWEQNPFGHAWLTFSFDSSTGVLFAGDALGNFYALDLQNGKKQIHLPLACGKIRALLIHENGLFVATQHLGILSFDKNTFNPGLTYRVKDTAVNCLAIRKNYLLAGAKDGHCYQFDLFSENYIRRFPIHYQAVYGILWVADHWVTVSMDKTIKVWEESWGSCVQKIESKQGGHARSVNGIRQVGPHEFITFSDDKNWIRWVEKKSSLSWSEN